MEKTKPKKHKLLRSKIQLLVISMIILVMAAFAPIALNTYRETVYREVKKGIQNTLSNISDYLASQFYIFYEGTSDRQELIHAGRWNDLFDKYRKMNEDISYIFVYNEEGKEIFSYPEQLSEDEKKIIRQKTYSDMSELTKEEETHIEYLPSLKFFDSYQTIIPMYGRRQLYGHVRLGVSTKNVEKGISDTITNGIIVTVVLSFIGVLLSALLSHIMLKPIGNLTGAAKEIAGGNLKKRAEIETKDEIGVLGDMFNKMAAALDGRINDLETLQMLTKEISAKLNRDELLNIITNTFIKVSKCGRCALLTFDKNTYTLKIESGKGVFNKNIEIDIEGSVNSEVFAHKDAAIKENLNECPEYKLFYSEIETPSSNFFICVPVIVDDEIIATVNLAGRPKKYGNFTKEEISLLKTLANHSGVAMENAKNYMLAITDGMTGLFIHRYFQLRLDEEMEKAVKTKKNIALLMMDIDHFKNVNDTYGHQQGDVILKEVAKTLQNAIRKADIEKAQRTMDIPARYGGEEFAVILMDADINQAVEVAEKIRVMVENLRFMFEGTEIKITISIGASQWTPGESKENLIKKADNALYGAKEAGRNCTRYII